MSAIAYVPFFCLLYCFVNIFKMIHTLCAILHLFYDINVVVVFFYYFRA